MAPRRRLRLRLLAALLLIGLAAVWILPRTLPIARPESAAPSSPAPRSSAAAVQPAAHARALLTPAQAQAWAPTDAASMHARRAELESYRELALAPSLQAALAAMQDWRDRDPAWWYRLLDRVDAICRQQLELDGRPELAQDPQRQWALEELRRRCAGFHFRDYTAGADVHGWQLLDQARRPAAVARAEGEAAGHARAVDNARYSIDPEELAASLDYLDRQQLLPAALWQQLGPSRSDRDAAINVASLLVSCQRLGHCDLSVLEHVAACAEVGCNPALPAPELLRSLLPPRHYESGLALAQWLQTMSMTAPLPSAMPRD